MTIAPQTSLDEILEKNKTKQIETLEAKVGSLAGENLILKKKNEDLEKSENDLRIDRTAHKMRADTFDNQNQVLRVSETKLKAKIEMYQEFVEMLLEKLMDRAR